MEVNLHPSRMNCESTKQNPDSVLSARAVQTMKFNPKFNEYLSNAKANKYHPKDNPEGIVPFGLAENKVAIDVLYSKLEFISKLPEDKKLYSYGLTYGEESFRRSLKRFLEHNFHPLEEINIDQLIVTNGVTVILENLAFALAQPGEYIMITKPYYYRLIVDFFERPGVLALSVDQPLPSEIPGNRYKLDVPGLEEAYYKAAGEGKIVRAIHITNPNNPTGDVYSAQELTDLLQFAHRHQLHVIANELYGLSMYDPDVNFTSILTLPHPDPERVHFLWGFSKDLGLSGVRIATLYTKNTALLKYFRQTAIYIRPTEMGQRRMQHLIDDEDFMDNHALPEVRQRLKARHQSVKREIEGCGGRVHDSPATVFRWLDLSPFLTTLDFQSENELFQRIYSSGVHLMPGKSLGHSKPGWFRMVAGLENDVHEEGMTRLVSVLNAIREEKKQQEQQQTQ